MSVLHAAVPLFFSLMAVEWVAARRRGRRVYEWRDSVMDLGCSILSQICGVYLALLSIGAYRLVEQAALERDMVILVWPRGGPLSSPEAALAWITVFILVDFGQYCVHRASHRVSFLWACHLVHHSSEQLNYAVALRNSSLHGLFLWMVPLPLALVGVPWQVFAVCYGLNVAYQFWLHTRVVGRLGPLEQVLNTPSHHRVHHGREPEYVDRNFGGVFIVWDRLFGTFAEERQEPLYGITPRLPLSDPVWANLWGFVAIAHDVRRSPSWREKLAAVLGPPRWSEPAMSPPRSEPARGQPPLEAYAMAQFLVLLMTTVALLDRLALVPMVDVTAYGTLAALTLTGVGGLLEGRRWTLRFEVIRLSAAALAAILPGLRDTPLLPQGSLAIYSITSLLALLLLSVHPAARAGAESPRS
jgi:sterol desaturase/sphingolipid hydroxylase (fatty acid hydroxylase superfamily)